MNEKYKVLIVDDENSIRQFLADALFDDYLVAEAVDGMAGIREVLSTEYDVIVVDVKMPRVGGIEVLKSVKAEKPLTEVVMLTAYASVNTAMEAVRLGAFDYLTKPAKIMDIRKVVSNAAEKSRLARQHKQLLQSLQEANQQLRQHVEHVEKLNCMMERGSQENLDLTAQLKRLNNELERRVEMATLNLDQTNRRLRENFEDTIKALVSAVEMKDTYTRGHSARVAEFTVTIARKLGLPEDEIALVNYAAILHDVGKIGIDEKILTKPAHLSDEEYKIIKLHPQMGDKIIQTVEFLAPVRHVVRNHHERYDGRGYVDGLKGEAIPIAARITAVADAYDAMFSDRAYRRSLTKDDAIEILKDNAGSQFDPEVVRAFEEIVRSSHPSE